MKIFETKKQKAFFSLAMAIVVCVWFFLSLWWMSSIEINEDNSGWSGALAGIISSLFAYSVYCLLEEKESRFPPLIGAIITFVITGVSGSFLFGLFEEYLITQFVSVVWATLLCIIGAYFIFKWIINMK